MNLKMQTETVILTPLCKPVNIRNPPPTLIVKPKPGCPAKGLLITPAGVFPCALGRSGTTSRKREGDGATPLGPMAVLAGYYRPDRARGLTRRMGNLPLQPVATTQGWCDAPNDRNYNRPVTRGYGASHEVMWRQDQLYDIVIILDWNIRQRRRQCGSAIFFHMAKPGFPPTEGCIAVSPRVMRRLLPLLTSRTVIAVQR
jgi:L,D-peptidoglycan transpeptidase YkuD (ErfK/YbiS/YcfS/YnhG family)